MNIVDMTKSDATIVTTDEEEFASYLRLFNNFPNSKAWWYQWLGESVEPCLPEVAAELEMQYQIKSRSSK